MGFYPQSPEDEILLDNFRDVVAKYRTLCLDGMIVKPKNGTYPRLSITHKRGARAGEELVNFLCRMLINDPPLSIIHDIEDAEFCFNPKYELLGSTKPLTFMVLQDEIPNYKKLNWRPPLVVELIDLKK
tara:strand:+ start:265 stop:651 length:387 start_codon:yes stop_codon:yes gene_type:complete